MSARRLMLVVTIGVLGAGCGHQRPPLRANEPPPPGENFSATALESTPTPSASAVPPGAQPPVHRPAPATPAH